MEKTRRAAGPSEFLKGRILIAMPGIGDPRFERAVLLLCSHDGEHAMGIVLNRPLEGLSIAGLLQRLGLETEGAPETPVLFGGPVERERGYVLHSDDYESQGSTIAVADGVAMTDTSEVLDALGDATRRPRRALLALGYAGWGPGQLEGELRQGVWLACDPDEDLLFGDDHEHKWSAALAKIGVSPEHLSPQAGRA
jgi:putative transcriptional regulator